MQIKTTHRVNVNETIIIIYCINICIQVKNRQEIWLVNKINFRTVTDSTKGKSLNFISLIF